MEYWANQLTLRSEDGGASHLALALNDIRIDLLPHQITAVNRALQALREHNGAILADEVGLGKTIEAGIIINQHWQQGKRKILRKDSGVHFVNRIAATHNFKLNATERRLYARMEEFLQRDNLHCLNIGNRQLVKMTLRRLLASCPSNLAGTNACERCIRNPSRLRLPHL